MQTEIPDALPVLSKGHHPVGSGKACVMDAVSWLMGRPEEGDAPSCVHPVLREAAVRVNDALPDSERHKLWQLVPDLIGTADERTDPHERKVLSVRLAVWCARQVLPLVRPRHRAVYEAAIHAAEGWCDGMVSVDKCRKAAAAANAANAGYATADAAYAAYAAADAAYAAAAAGASAATADAGYATANAAAAASAAAVNAAYAAATYADAGYAADAAANAVAAADRLELLTGLVAEHKRLTGHTPRPVVRQEWAELSDMLGVVR